jgi:hypothetical protein
MKLDKNNKTVKEGLRNLRAELESDRKMEIIEEIKKIKSIQGNNDQREVA